MLHISPLEATVNLPDVDYCVNEFRVRIDSVRLVTHIAPPDVNGHIIGEPVKQDGVIEYPVDDLFLCASVTGAKYTSTSEVYPDSPNASQTECNKAQVACVVGGLEFVIQEEGLVKR